MSRGRGGPIPAAIGFGGNSGPLYQFHAFPRFPAFHRFEGEEVELGKELEVAKGLLSSKQGKKWNSGTENRPGRRGGCAGSLGIRGEPRGSISASQTDGLVVVGPGGY
jgi:hypothetical protein